MEIINFEDFIKIDLRIGKIIEAEKVEGSTKIIKTIVDLGEDKKQVLAGIGEFYTPEELIDKVVAVVVNLSPKKIMGFDSEGMILAVKDGESLSLLGTDKEIKIGSKIS
ncbi:MAG: methionine--tRNA ligase subunit beta [Candidatus Pacebacteria bacterium]|nr:methionine--tRNA ligase subunit beta [Candidatus Paceibacterota bacterium]MDD2757007.1 methionine--tRNA ligase subunit beta [Candidatus Paceibacterota bacterium]MDD3283517.1 methionine--tRNA ligase subunit beta [Candidatus Paceibacterota bacterium]MDD3969627.1 methionine--tRNA ligase subunit beta [Candidatus Paceibacterota bacterium]MDD4738033.1 methionine--tRNA ligase subunit beta [Candidatus Paceibacterota bacterium]